jgi:hypothetical protein
MGASKVKTLNLKRTKPTAPRNSFACHKIKKHQQGHTNSVTDTRV